MSQSFSGADCKGQEAARQEGFSVPGLGGVGQVAGASPFFQDMCPRLGAGVRSFSLQDPSSASLRFTASFIPGTVFPFVVEGDRAALAAS